MGGKRPGPGARLSRESPQSRRNYMRETRGDPIRDTLQAEAARGGPKAPSMLEGLTWPGWDFDSCMYRRCRKASPQGPAPE